MPIFDPLSTFYTIWALLIRIITLLTFIYLPIRLCLEPEENSEALVFNIFPILFAFDIFIKANTSYFERDSTIIRHSDIF